MVIGSVENINAPALQTISADQGIEVAIERMLDDDFSQLGISKDGNLLGVLSYKSIARAMVVAEELFDSPERLGDRSTDLAVDKPRKVSKDTNLDDLLDLLGQRAFVLIEDESACEEPGCEVPYRIVTDYDIREFWRRQTEPFLLIEETEMAIRSIISTAYTGDLPSALKQMTDDSNLSEVDSIDECSFSHYERFISTHWKSGFSDYFHQKRDFVRELIGRVGEDRNRLFHFRTENRTDLNLDVVEYAHGYFTSIRPEEED